MNKKTILHGRIAHTRPPDRPDNFAQHLADGTPRVKPTLTSERKRIKALQKMRDKGLRMPIVEAPKPIVWREGLFLDDERMPKEVTWKAYDNDIRWKIVRTPEEFMVEACRKVWAVYSFDYYLGGNQTVTGLDLMEKWVALFPTLGVTEENLPDVYIHSQHADGERDMDRYWHHVCSAIWNKKEVPLIAQRRGRP